MARQQTAEQPEVEVVKKLEGRELTLVLNAALELKAAVEQTERVKADGLVRQQQFQAVLELVTGEEPTDMGFDFGTGEVTRPKRPKSRKRRATTKGTKKAKGGR